MASPHAPPRGAAPKDYFLSEEENRAVFDAQIAPTQLRPFERHGHVDDGVTPVCVILTGQTGAGKTRTGQDFADALAALGRRHFVHLVADTYKSFHPRWDRLIAERPAVASAAASKDARHWFRRACEHAAAHRVDCVVESACRYPDDFSHLARAFRAAGYRVLAVLMAVHESQSRLGIQYRFRFPSPDPLADPLPPAPQLPPRLTPPAIHDESYRGLESVAAFVDATDAVDRVAVLRRNNLAAFESELDAATASSSSSHGPVSKALADERRRPGVAAEVEAFARDLAALRATEAAQADLDDIARSFADVQASGGGGDLPDLRELDCRVFITG